MATDELSGIERLLADRIGLDPVSVGPQLILRAARQRMRELALDDMAAYECRVRQSESELQALIEEVVVSESWFFRDERPYQWFREYIRVRWLDDPLRPPLRILSLPCAGGEEPYSIAITLRDLGLSANRFHINAVDVSAHRLAMARHGVYSSNAFRGVDHGVRARYFREHPQGYELDSSIRSTVRFLQASALDPHLLEDSPPYDVVFCRNLLIYLGATARVCVSAVIERLLAADGVLFIGHADRLDVFGVEPKFTVVGDPACFVYRLRPQGNAALPHSLPQLEPPRSMSGSIAPGSASSGALILPPLAAIGITTRTDRSGEAAMPASPVNEPSLLDQAAELANRGRFDAAVAACERHILLKGFSPPAYYLMGMICQAAGNRLRAEDCFHKTVYLDPMHDEALLALALLAERRGDHDAASSFRRRAERSVTMSRKQVN
jgi:chemotaxis protein methyltransferase WspC